MQIDFSTSQEHQNLTRISQHKKTKSKSPLVSICCITYNHEPFIRKSLESFLMQETSFPVEILIHDDASTDRTAEIIREYEEKHPNLIFPIYQRENQFSNGIKISFTYQFPRARGKYIALCEGDDYWTDPLKLQKQVTFLENNQDFVICYHDAGVIDENDHPIKDSRLPAAYKRDASSEDLKKGFEITTHTMCFRNCIQDYPVEHKYAFGGDKFLTSLLGAFGKGKYLENISPSRFRVHSGGINSGVKDEKEKYINALKTRIALFQYYDRIGDMKVRDYFLTKIHRMTHYIITLDKPSESQHRFKLSSCFVDFVKKIYSKSQK